jgi:hypothetical protein
LNFKLLIDAVNAANRILIGKKQECVDLVGLPTAAEATKR